MRLRGILFQEGKGSECEQNVNKLFQNRLKQGGIYPP